MKYATNERKLGRTYFYIWRGTLTTVRRSCGFLQALPIVALILAPTLGQAQFFRNSNYWKTHRSELSLGFGVSNFLGDLGGRDQIGTDFLWDLEISQTRPAFNFGYRYFVAEHMAVRGMLSYGTLAGSDALTNEPVRQNRNLHFRSPIMEGAVVFEYHPWRERTGHMYDLRGVKSSAKSSWGFYGFAGIGMFTFNPKAQMNGNWVRLQPLGTEGQGLGPTAPDPYKLVGVCVPMGMGIRRPLNKQITLGLEWQYTLTFTDYIDDVSTVYYDNARIEAVRGPVAAWFADPSLGLIATQTNTGEQRGDPDDNDAYLFIRVQLDYKLFRYRSGSGKYRAKARKQKVVF